MANTRITQGVIKPNEDYDVRHINATGIITATNLNLSGVLTYEDVTNVDSIGVITARKGIVSSGVVTASAFHGDGSALTGIDATALKDPAGNVKIQAQASGAMHTGFSTMQNLRVTGIATFGSGSTTINNNTINVGTALTLGHTQGVQFLTQNLHSEGFEVNQINASGIITASSFSGDGSNLTSLPAGLGTALSSTQSSPLNKIYYTNSVLPVESTITVDTPASASAAYTQYTDISLGSGADLIISDGDDLIPDVLGLRPDGTFGGGALGRMRVDKLVGKDANSAVNVEKGLVITGVTTSTNVSVASSVTATTYYGSGANLTGISAGTSLSGSTNNTVCTVTGANAIQGESNVHIDSNGRLIIADTDTANAFSGGDDLVIGNNNSGTRSGLSIVSHSAQDGGIYFSKGTGNDQVRGQIVYQHDGNGGYMRLYTNTDERVRLTATGQLEVGSPNTISSGDFALIEAPTSFNSGETIVTIAGNSTTTGPRLNLQNRNTGANACSEVLGADAGGQSTSYIRFNHIDQTNNHGEISFGTRNAQGTPPAEVMRINKDGLLTKPETPFVMVHIQTTSNRNTTGSYLVVPWDIIHLRSTSSNVGNHFNTTNHRFTAPVAGRYFFCMSLNIVGDNIIKHRINGSDVSKGEYRDSNDAKWDHVDASFIYDMNANDYYDVVSSLTGSGQRFNGGSNGYEGWDTLSIYLLG